MIRTSCDAIELGQLISTLCNKDLRNQMRTSKERLKQFENFTCSDGITPLNSLLGVINVLIYVFLEESPLANYNRVTECKAMVYDYLTSTNKLGLLNSTCLTAFCARDLRFWNTISMHYAEKWTQMIDCIVNEGINPSQRVNGLLFTRQIGNSYPSGESTMSLLTDYREQFWNVPGGQELFASYFEAGQVRDSPNETVNIALCFSNHYKKYSTQQLASVDFKLNDSDVKKRMEFFKIGNSNAGNFNLMY